MKVWITIDSQLPLGDVGASAHRAEALGADCITVADNAHDGLLAAFAAIQATSHVEIATMALVCFARSPMVTAVAAWGLQEAAKGRFRLGLGPLIAPIMRDKYSTPWSPPAPRMRDYIASLQAIFTCWHDDEPLHHIGPHYRFTRQSSYNKPPMHSYRAPPIHLGAIGPKMTALAGEATHGVMTHPTNSSPEFLRERLLPQLTIGAGRTGRSVEELEILVNPPLALGHSQAAIERKREQWRALLAILLSTPNYGPSLELFGYPELGAHLKMLVRENRWSELAGKIEDPLLDRFVPRSSYDELPDLVSSLYSGLATTMCLSLPEDAADDMALATAIEKLKSI